MLHIRHIAYFDPRATMKNFRGAYGTKDPLTSPKTFGERLRLVRIAWGWSQGRLAETLGTNQRLVSHWERDIAKPSAAALTSLSSLLGISTEALLAGNEFTIPDMPVLVEGVARDTVAQFTALGRLLPKPENGRIAVVDLNAFESKPLNLDEAVRVLKGTKGTDAEVWVVVRTGQGSKKASCRIRMKLSAAAPLQHLLSQEKGESNDN